MMTYASALFTVLLLGTGACALSDAAAGPPARPDEETGEFPPVLVESIQTRVWYDPYEEVDWATTLRLKAQTHDHTGISAARLLSYDSAGYSFVPVMDYSGVASLSYAMKRRLWPWDSVLPATLVGRTRSVLAWVPDAEEVGQQHLISLFLTKYIAKWEPAQYPARAAWMYSTTQEAIGLITALGGFPILAHPWGPWRFFENLTGYRGMEIYSAYAEHRFEVPTDVFFGQKNRNQDLVAAWDLVLLRGAFVVGVAVNDHFGPYNPPSAVSPRVRDSGKIIVVTADGTLAGFEDAMRRGSIFAVADFGARKGVYPSVDSVWVALDEIHVATSGSVRWIVDGNATMDTSHSLKVWLLPALTRVVRLEVSGSDGSTVYVQPFFVRARGDVNGDFALDSRDDLVCAEVAAGRDPSPVHRAACLARARLGTT